MNQTDKKVIQKITPEEMQQAYERAEILLNEEEDIDYEYLENVISVLGWILGYYDHPLNDFENS